MAAVTGKTAIVVKPGPRKTGAEVKRLPEASSQTFPVGALLSRTAGSLKMGSTGTSQSVSLLGFAIQSGQSLSADGLAKTPYYAFEQGKAIKITLGGTWTGSAHRGATAGFTMNTAGAVFLQTTAASVGTIVREVEWDNGVAVADGDVNVVVYFIPADAALAV
jgi:hypothetical protein